MSSAPPTPPTRPTSGPPLLGPRPSAANNLYGLQVRAFVEAAEVVDADPEVIEDILDGFPLDGLSEGPETLELEVDEDQDVDVEAEGAHGPAAAARSEEVDNTAADVETADPEEEEFAMYLQEGKLLPRLGSTTTHVPFLGICVLCRVCCSESSARGQTGKDVWTFPKWRGGAGQY